MADGSQLIGTIMETQNRFDLNRACLRWRQDLVQQGITPAEANELESHLHDAMADLQSRGLSQEEAFWIARHRLGPVFDLADQFAKANPARVWQDRIFWGAALTLVWLAWMQIVGLSIALLRTFGDSVGLHGGWNYLAVQIVTLLPLPVVAVLLARGTLSKICAVLTRPFFTPRRLATVSVVLVAGMLGVQSLMLYQIRSYLPAHLTGQVTAAINFFGSLLASAVWPVTLVLVMLRLAPRQKQPAA